MIAQLFVDARYHIRSSAGESSRSYGDTDITPIFGTSQGSGSSPQIWNGTSCKLLSGLDANYKGVHLFIPDWRHSMTFNAVLFANNNSMYEAGGNDLVTLVKSLEAKTQS